VVSGRLVAVAALLALGVALVLPSWVGVVVACAVLVALAGADLAAVARPGDLTLSRPALTTVRLGRSTEVELSVVNAGARTVRGMLWDDWPESAGATHRTRRIDLAPNTMTRLRTALEPRYRGDRVAGPVTVRLFGPLGLAGRQFHRTVEARVRALPAFRSE